MLCVVEQGSERKQIVVESSVVAGKLKIRDYIKSTQDTSHDINSTLHSTSIDCNNSLPFTHISIHNLQDSKIDIDNKGHKRSCSPPSPTL